MQRAKVIKLPKGRVVSNGPKGTWNLIYVPDGETKPTSKLLGKLDEIDEAEAYVRALEFLDDERRKAFTVGRVAIEYERLKLSEKDASISKRRSYRSLLRKIAGRFGAEIFENLTTGEVEDWILGLPLAPRSKGEVRGQMSRLWKFAQKRGMVSRELGNPMSLIEIANVSKRMRATISMTPEVFHQFKEQLAEPYSTFALVSVSHGLRQSEALGLKWLDFDFDRRTVFIRRTFVRGVVQESTKTEGSRARLEMDDELVEHLKTWRLNSPFPKEADWVFPSPGGRGTKPGERPLSPHAIHKHYMRAGKRIGLERVNSHVMRHSHRSWMGLNQVDPKVQQMAMRHAKLSTTMDVYGMVLDQAAASEAQKLVTRMAFRPKQHMEEGKWKKQ